MTVRASDLYNISHQQLVIVVVVVAAAVVVVVVIVVVVVLVVVVVVVVVVMLPQVRRERIYQQSFDMFSGFCKLHNLHHKEAYPFMRSSGDLFH